MSDSSWLSILQQQRAIGVIRSPQLSLGKHLALSIAAGGMQLIEITWNGDRPAELIAQLRAELPACMIGAGTLLTSEQIHDAMAAGAQFLFTPHTNPAIIKIALAAGVPIIPGALSPTEIVTAWQAAATCVKVFPVSAAGGVTYIKSLQGPLGQIPLIPTGGVTLDNAADFIAAGAIGVGLSSSLFPKDLLAARNWQAIAQTARTLMEKLTTI
ncbi:MAG: bifunctional 4-hydroxy-2-oxoglutarate aldolase/2-dehydro-3-deoxy-phosphogluconate aldolase [Hormoscilla sp.]